MELVISLDRSASPPLPHQISRAITDMIARGSPPAGSRLPGTRELARQLSVGRTTVVEAYELLSQHGYISSRRGSGTLVEVAATRASAKRSSSVAHRTAARLLSSRVTSNINFRPDLPDLKAFPKRRWLAALIRCSRDIRATDLDYGDPLGSMRLRNAIACYVSRSRGLHVDSRNVIITSGKAQSVDIALQLLAPCAEAIVEEPCPPWLESVMHSHDVAVRPLPLDLNGLRTDQLPQDSGRRFVYVTPGHQWPTGCVMALDRRKDLMCWTRTTSSYVFEQDDDRELALQGAPPTPLACLDSAGQVIYSVCFDKTLAPALQLGFLVVPDALLARIASIKWWGVRSGYLTHHEALASWLERGDFERHVQRMRRVYRERYALITDTLQSLLPDRVRLVGEPIGTHITALIRTDLSIDALSRTMQAQGIKIHPIEHASGLAEDTEKAFAFGFGNLSEQEIVTGIRSFAQEIMSN